MKLTHTKGYFVNGFKFHTQDYGYKKSTINCGVWVRGSTHDDPKFDFNGMLREVIELNYVENSVILFKCDWYDTSRRGLNVDHHGLIKVKYKSCLPGYEPFVLA